MPPPDMSRVFAIVPAAGRSRRMGTAKQLLNVGGRPMLADVLDAVTASQVIGVALVTHAEIATRLDLTRWLNAFAVINDDATSEMIDSVRMGIAAWSQRANLRPRDGMLVCPGDHPGISTADFDACIAAFREDATRVVVATREGVRGHPLIFPAELVEFVCSPACMDGLNALKEAHAERVREVACASAGVTRDVDTREDYERL